MVKIGLPTQEATERRVVTKNQFFEVEIRYQRPNGTWTPWKTWKFNHPSKTIAKAKEVEREWVQQRNNAAGNFETRIVRVKVTETREVVE